MNQVQFVEAFKKFEVILSALAKSVLKAVFYKFYFAHSWMSWNKYFEIHKNIVTVCIKTVTKKNR